MPKNDLVGTFHQFAGSPRTFRSTQLSIFQMMRRIVLLIGLVLPSFLFSQPKIKWGEVAKADLEMKTFPQDTNATAVILNDIGEVAFDNRFEMVFKRHRRVKILTKAGFDWGTVGVTYYAKEQFQRVADVEGHTFNLAANGAIRKDKLDKKSLFDENVDGTSRRARFTLPALEPGSVIEYRYTINSKPGAFRFLRDWTFQNAEPTLWSEFRADIPDVLNYVRVQQGLVVLDVNETEATPWPPTSQTTVFAKLTADGAIAGRFMSSDAGYSGLSGRRTLRDKKAEDYVRDGWLKDLAGAKLDSCKIGNQDSTHQALTTEAHFSAADYAPVAGDNIYFNPLLFGRQKENPFKRPARTFPVDYAYAFKQAYTLNLTLPEGYTVQETPKNLTLVTPKEGIKFRRVTLVDGNNVQVMYQLTIRKPHFEPIEYPALRELYDQVVAAQAEQIVLKRGTAATAGKDGAK